MKDWPVRLKNFQIKEDARRILDNLQKCPGVGPRVDPWHRKFNKMMKIQEKILNLKGRIPFKKLTIEEVDLSF